MSSLLLSQRSPFIRLSLVSMGTDCNISESYYKGTILTTFERFHSKKKIGSHVTMVCQNLWYSEM